MEEDVVVLVVVVVVVQIIPLCVCVAQFRKIEDVDVIIINFFTSRTAYPLATA